MDENQSGPQTPEERQVVRQHGLAAQMLELWIQRDDPEAAARLTELADSHSRQDLLSGLLYVADSLGMAHGKDAYLNTLHAWQTAAEVVDALEPVLEEEEGKGG